VINPSVGTLSGHSSALGIKGSASQQSESKMCVPEKLTSTICLVIVVVILQESAFLDFVYRSVDRQPPMFSDMRIQGRLYLGQELGQEQGAL
jgi:hypothetical protein